MSKKHKRPIPRDHDAHQVIDWGEYDPVALADWEIKLLRGEKPPLPQDAPMTPEEEEMEAQEYTPAHQGTAYISGPMRGRPNFNYDLFNEVEKVLVGQGWNVLNPTRHFDGDQSRTPAEYMKLDLVDVIEADALFMLPDWQDSEGARLEYQAAKFLGKQFYFVNGATSTEPIELTASGLVRNGQREATYGHPGQDFMRTAHMWTGLLEKPVSPLEVALAMVQLKVSRLKADPNHHDSLVDAVGYLICYQRVLESMRPMEAIE